METAYSNSTVALFNSFSPYYSLSMSLKDTVKLYSSLLRTARKNLSSTINMSEILFTPTIKNQLDKEKFETGAGWNLTDDQLRYLGKVAWSFGCFLDQRTLVVLLVDKGIGVIVSTRNNDRIILHDLQVLAHKVLDSYATQELKLQAPKYIKPTAVSMEGTTPIVPGVYASEFGALMVEAKESYILVMNRGGFAKFIHIGNGIYKPESQNEYEYLLQERPGEIILRWTSGATNTFMLHEPGKDHIQLKLKPGTYTSTNPKSRSSTLTFSIKNILGNFILPMMRVEIICLFPYLKQKRQ